MNVKIIIGIDPGVKTGLAVKTPKGKWQQIETMTIHEAMSEIQVYAMLYSDVFVMVEDARQRKWFGPRANMKQQGAGSVKRDCKIWEDFLTDLGVTFKMVHPKAGATKLDKEKFQRLTGWEKRTNEHARDAAMLIHGVNANNLKLLFG